MRLRILPLACLLALACSHHPVRISVSAASSLTDVLPEIAAAWKKKGGVDVDFNFGASSSLANQIAQGAPADLFVSADEKWMAELNKMQMIDGASRVDLAMNELVAVVPAASGVTLKTPADLLAPGVNHLGLAGENVPAGRYARQALTAVMGGIQGRIVNGANVRQTLELVAQRSVDAGIVYRTDAIAEPRVRVAFTFTPTSHVPIVYPAAIVRNAPHPSLARRFLAFCHGTEGRKIFEKAGFGLPQSR